MFFLDSMLFFFIFLWSLSLFFNLKSFLHMLILFEFLYIVIMFFLSLMPLYYGALCLLFLLFAAMDGACSLSLFVVSVCSKESSLLKKKSLLI